MERLPGLILCPCDLTAPAILAKVVQIQGGHLLS